MYIPTYLLIINYISLINSSKWRIINIIFICLLLYLFNINNEKIIVTPNIIITIKYLFSTSLTLSEMLLYLYISFSVQRHYMFIYIYITLNYPHFLFVIIIINLIAYLHRKNEYDYDHYFIRWEQQIFNKVYTVVYSYSQIYVTMQTICKAL